MVFIWFILAKLSVTAQEQCAQSQTNNTVYETDLP